MEETILLKIIFCFNSRILTVRLLGNILFYISIIKQYAVVSDYSNRCGDDVGKAHDTALPGLDLAVDILDGSVA